MLAQTIVDTVAGAVTGGGAAQTVARNGGLNPWADEIGIVVGPGSGTIGIPDDLRLPSIEDFISPEDLRRFDLREVARRDPVVQARIQQLHEERVAARQRADVESGGNADIVVTARSSGGDGQPIYEHGSREFTWSQLKHDVSYASYMAGFEAGGGTAVFNDADHRVTMRNFAAEQAYIDELNELAFQQLDRPLILFVVGSAAFASGLGAYAIAGEVAAAGTATFYATGGGIGASSGLTFTEVQYQLNSDPNKQRGPGEYIANAALGGFAGAGFQPINSVAGSSNRYILGAANGGVYGGVTNAVGQGINRVYSGQDIILSDIGYATAFGAGFGVISPRIPGLTSGPNNWNARYQGRLTARRNGYNNGYIVNIGADTSARAAIANNVVPLAQGAAATSAEIIRQRNSGQ